MLPLVAPLALLGVYLRTPALTFLKVARRASRRTPDLFVGENVTIGDDAWGVLPQHQRIAFSLIILRAGVGGEIHYVPGAVENVSNEYFRDKPGNGICERGVLLVFGNMVPQCT